MIDSESLRGADDLIARLRALGAEASKNGGPVRSGLAAGAKLIREAAKERAPVKTGALRKHIKMVRDGNPKRSGAAERYVVGVFGGVRSTYANTRANRRKGRVGQAYAKEGSTYYWRFLEFGTEKMKARPFLRPAFEQNAQAAFDAVVAGTSAALDRLTRRIARMRR